MFYDYHRFFNSKNKMAIFKKGALKTGVKLAVKDIKKAGATIKKEAVKILAKADIRDVPFAALLPFKGMMRNGLNEKKIAHVDHMYDIVPKFYNHVVRQNHFDSLDTEFAASPYYRLRHEADFENHADKAAVGAAVSAGANIAVAAATGNVGQMVTEVLKYIKSLKDRKNAGKTLSPAEQKILDQAEDAADKIKIEAVDAAEESISDVIKEFVFSWKGIVSLVALLGLSYLAFSKK